MAFTFDQIATILNTIVADATGQNAAALSTPRNTSDFVTAATTALEAGLDPVMNSITQLTARTVFAVRAKEADIALLDQDNLTYGSIVRKITPIFTDAAEDQPMFNDIPADGQSVDHYKIKRPKALETRFTGFKQYAMQAPSVFEDQLRSAFTGPDQLGDFLAAQFTAVRNLLNLQKETLARGTIANMIGAKQLRGGSNVYHLITLYNDQTGLSLTTESVWQPDNIKGFVTWLYAFIADLSDMMTKQSVLYHEGITGYTIMRHTPKSMQRVLIYSKLLRQIQAMVLSGTYHDDLLSMDVTAPIEYFQSITDRNTVNVNATYTAADGTIAKGDAKVENVVGIIYDRDSMGININLERVATTPINARALYYNTYYHIARRYYNDVTENCAVLCLD